MAQASLTGPLTKQVFQYGLVLVPEAIERIPARTPVRQGVPPNPASTGELVKVLAGAHPTVKGLQDFSSHSNAGLCEAGAVGWVCDKEHGQGRGAVSQSGKGKCFEKDHDSRKVGRKEKSWGKVAATRKYLRGPSPSRIPTARGAGDRCEPTYLCGTGPPGPQNSPEAVQPAVERHLPRPAPAGCESLRDVLSSSGIPPGEHRVTRELASCRWEVGDPRLQKSSRRVKAQAVFRAMEQRRYWG